MISIEELKQIEEVIKGSVSGFNARVEAKYEIIEYKLDSIDQHLTKLNGKVAKHEARLNEVDVEHAKEQVNYKNRGNSCPHINTIEDLKTENKGRKKITKFVLASLSITSLILTILYTLTKLGVVN